MNVGHAALRGVEKSRCNCQNERMKKNFHDRKVSPSEYLVMGLKGGLITF